MPDLTIRHQWLTTIRSSSDRQHDIPLRLLIGKAYAEGLSKKKKKKGVMLVVFNLTIIKTNGEVIVAVISKVLASMDLQMTQTRLSGLYFIILMVDGKTRQH